MLESSFGGCSWERDFSLLNPGKGKWAKPIIFIHICLMWQLGWDGLLTFIWAYQSQAEEVRSQASVTEVVFHIIQKSKLKAYVRSLFGTKNYMKKNYASRMLPGTYFHLRSFSGWQCPFKFYVLPILVGFFPKHQISSIYVYFKNAHKYWH